jgi:beta-galactosidase
MCFEPSRRQFITALGALAASPRFAFSQAARVPGPWTRSGKINFGADYYVEDWPAERLEIDAQLMAQAGFNTVRLIDTNWQRLEPIEGKYSFAWLDHALEVLNRYKIQAILCTSSYAPPPWLIAKHPEISLIDEEGHRHPSGGLGWLCLNNPTYRLYVEKLVVALGLHYGHHAGVIGWQIDNEFGYWGQECYDPLYCLPAFRYYLQAKFVTLEELNRRLHTVSYGHEYTAWDQINLRLHIHSDGDSLQVPLVLEARRFFSHNFVQFMDFQAKLLRTHTTGQFITHNGPNTANNVFDLARPLDFLGEDNYPQVTQFAQPAFLTDLMRGANHGNTFQVLEMRSGTLGSYTLGDATPPPGLVRLWAWQEIAHGSDGTLFFRWRRNNAGAEPYWQGLLQNDGTPAPPYREIAQMGAELRQHGDRLAQAPSPARVAGIVSYDSDWATNIGFTNYPYFEQLASWTQAFRRMQLNVDLVEPNSDLSPYQIVFAPALYIVDEAITRWLQDFVTQGGTLILGPRAGVANEDDVARLTPPGPLASLAQVRVDSFTLLGKISSNAQPPAVSNSPAYKPAANNIIRSVSADWPGPFSAGVWADLFTLTGAQPLYHYTEDFYAGQPAIAMAETGKGRTVYIGTILVESFYLAFVERLCRLAGVPAGPLLPEAVDFAIRQKSGATFRFLLNFGKEAQTVVLTGNHQDLLTGSQFSGSVAIPPFDLRILIEN